MQIEYEGERQTEGGGEKDFLRIPVTKGSSKEEKSWVEVCLDDLPGDVYKEALLQGLKTLLNRGMSKITDAKNDAGAREQAMEVAKANLQNLYEGKIKMTAGVRTKITGAVKTEAMRLARILIKDALKAAGKKPSLIPSKAITEAAKQYLESDTEDSQKTWKDAEANIKAREAKKDGTLATLKGFVVDIEEDATMVQKAEARKKPKKAAAKAPHLAAGQAQRVQPDARH